MKESLGRKVRALVVLLLPSSAGSTKPELMSIFTMKRLNSWMRSPNAFTLMSAPEVPESWVRE